MYIVCVFRPVNGSPDLLALNCFFYPYSIRICGIYNILVIYATESRDLTVAQHVTGNSDRCGQRSFTAQASLCDPCPESRFV
jgi:hypothetical protein